MRPSTRMSNVYAFKDFEGSSHRILIGLLFLSVPNIANVTVRLGLLFGVFEYRDRGILDYTHLRFFTMRTIRREVENAGFHIVALRGSSVPIRLIIGRFTPEWLLRIGE